MKTRQSIHSNLKWMVGSNLISKPLWLAFFLITARLLGPIEFGKFMYSISYLSIFSALFEGGIDIFTVRNLASNPSDPAKFILHTFIVKVLCNILVGIIVVFSLLVMSIAPSLFSLILVTVIYSSFSTLTNHFRYIFRGYEIMRYEAISILLEKILVISICGFVLIRYRDAFVFMYGYSVAYGILFVFTAWILKHQITLPKLQIDWRYLWSKVVRESLPYALTTLFMIIYFRSATILIMAFTHSDTLVGYYNAGYKLVEAFILLPSIIIAPIFPAFVRNQKDKNSINQLLMHSTKAIFLISIFIAVPIFVFNDAFTMLLFGAGFAPAAPCIGIVVLSIIPIGFTWIFGSLVGAIGRQKKANYYILFVTCLNLIMNSILIPLLSIKGAAITTLITELMIALSNMWIVKDFFNTQLLRMIAKIFVVMILAISIAMSGLLIGNFVFMVSELILFMCVGCFLLRVISIDDLRLIVRKI